MGSRRSFQPQSRALCPLPFVKLVFLFTGLVFSGAGTGAVSAPDRALFAAVEAGDVLFLEADGLWGDLARSFSDPGSPYGHVIVVVSVAAGRIEVIDAGGPLPAQGAGVGRRSLDRALKGGRAVTVYRPDLTPQERQRFLAALLAKEGLPFDRAFSLETEGALYCTELVWRALSEALGADAVPDKTDFAGEIAITLSDLAEAPVLQKGVRYALSP